MSADGIFWSKIASFCIFRLQEINPISNFNKINPKRWAELQRIESTYNVPATRVLTWELLSISSFARPKSETFGVKFLSRSILLALISLWIMRGSPASSSPARARATPTETFRLASQLNLNLFCSAPANQHTIGV
jgi:hypothetical protein